MSFGIPEDGGVPTARISRLALHDMRTFILYWSERHAVPNYAAVVVLEHLAKDLEDAIFAERGIRVDAARVIMEDFPPTAAPTAKKRTPS